jgi:tetratricopeptide (TPR) repeat protein
MAARLLGAAVSQKTTPSIQEMVREALRHHQLGRLDAAERLYRQVLAIDPDHADGLHLLGMIVFEAGQVDAAVELIRRAIAIKGNAASYHSNLGNILQSQGKLDEAGLCYQRALVLKPDSAEVYLNLGNIFKSQGNLESSLTCYRRAMTLSPALAEAATAEAAVLLLGNQGSRYTGARLPMAAMEGRAVGVRAIIDMGRAGHWRRNHVCRAYSRRGSHREPLRARLRCASETAVRALVSRHQGGRGRHG